MEEARIEDIEQKIMKFRALRKRFVELAEEHKPARINLRETPSYEQVINDEMFIELFDRVDELEKLFKG